MTQIITIEFTDAQWALVQEHLQFTPDRDVPSEPIAMTVEQLSQELFTVVQRRVTQARIVEPEF